MSSQLDVRLTEFHADLEKAERLLELINLFRTFGASATTHISDPNMKSEWKEALELGESAQIVRPDLPILSGALHSYVCGRFEYFIRDVVITVADTLSGGAATYSELPEKLRTELMQMTLMVAQNPGRYGYSAEQAESLLISLASNLNGSGTVSVQSEVLAITEANMHPKMISDVMKRVGITSIWPELGKQARLKTFLETRADGDCSQEAQSRLASIIRERNSFAHPTSSTEFPDVDQVRATCGFLRALSEVLVDVAKLPA